MWVRDQTNFPIALHQAKEDLAHTEYEAACAPKYDMDGLYKT